MHNDCLFYKLLYPSVHQVDNGTYRKVDGGEHPHVLVSTLKFRCSNSSTHFQNKLNKAYALIVVVGKKATGIYQSENRLTAIKTNMCLASSGVVGKFCLADKHCSK